MYFLYEKTHKQTGLKYLGQTKENPYLYTGSGIDWKKHLKEYGSDIDTYVLFQSESWDEIVYWGRYYSQLYNIVNAQDDFGNKIWANRIPETGGGAGNWNEHTKLKHKISLKTAYRNVQVLKKCRDIRNDPIIKETHRASVIKTMNSEDFKKKYSGKNHHCYDHEIYEFHHESGLVERCTRKELILKYNLNDGHIWRLINFRRKTHKGWKMG